MKYNTYDTDGVNEDGDTITIAITYEWEMDEDGYAITIVEAVTDNIPYAYSQWEYQKWLDEISEYLNSRDEEYF